jgi:thiamine-phosphate pyrophosphorylase
MVSVPRLCALVSDQDDLTLLPAIARAGVDGFQVRAKGLTDRDLLALVRRVRELTGGRGDAPLVIVNDRVDVALAAGADGVHLGREDLPVEAARRLTDGLRPGLLVGATCRDRAQVEQAASDGADYAGFGPVWATASKDGLPDPLGAAALTAAAGTLPLLAIGGVDAPRAAEAVAAGAHGVAVIGALWRQPDPVRAAEELVKAVC